MKPAKGETEVDGRKITWETTFDRSFRFRCSGKATCCVGGNYEVMERDLERAGKKRFEGKTEDMEGSRKKIKSKDNGECVFLEKGRCAIYEKRPSTCRTFPFTVIFTSENHAFVDLNWQCCALFCMDNPGKEGKGEDIGELVKEKYLALSSEKTEGKSLMERWLGNYRITMKISELLDRPKACGRVWEHISDSLGKQKDLVDTCGLITSFMQARQDIPHLLRLRHCRDYIRIAEGKESPEIGEAEWRNFMRNLFLSYKSYMESERRGKALNKKSPIDGTLYSERVGRNSVIFESDRGKKEIDIQSISRKYFEKDAEKFMIRYLKYIWKRKYAEIDFARLMNFVYSKTRAINLYSFAAQLLVSRHVLENLQFHLAVISERNGHERYTKEDVMETIDFMDTMVIRMSSSSRPVFEALMESEK